jgi:hypothetical protein
MAKKPSRAARVEQSGRLQEAKRDASARPIVANSGRVAAQPVKTGLAASDLAASAEAEVEPSNTSNENPSERTSNTVQRTATTQVPRRFLNAQPTKAPALSREEEYRYIRADLVTVLVLAVLMVIALVVLTIVIGR